MPGTPAEFANYQRRLAELEAKFGPNWMNLNPFSTIGPNGQMVDQLATPYRNMNPNNPNGQILQKKARTGYNNAEGWQWHSDSTGEEPVENPQAWDRNAFGNLADWNLTDTLPSGITVQAEIDRLKAAEASGAFGDPISSSAGQENFFKAALKSPGFGGVLAAAAGAQLLQGFGGFGTNFGPAGTFTPPNATIANGLGSFTNGTFPSLGGFSDISNTFADAGGGAGSGIDFGPPGTFTPPNATIENGLGSFTNGTFPSLPSLPSVPGSGTNFGPPGTFTPPDATVANNLGSVTNGTFPALGSTGASAAGSALSRLLNGSATAADYASLLGTIGATGLSAFTANRQADDLKGLADEYKAFGAPSRARYEGSFAPGFTMANEPGYKDALDSTSSSLLSRLSANAGNPFGTPGGLIEANKQINASLALPALQNYRNQNAATSGIASFNAAAPAAATGAIGASSGALTNIAGGLSDILNPKPPSLNLADLLRQFQQGGLV